VLNFIIHFLKHDIVPLLNFRKALYKSGSHHNDYRSLFWNLRMPCNYFCRRFTFYNLQEHPQQIRWRFACEYD